MTSKSFLGKNEISNYMLEHSIRQTPAQIKLGEATMKHPRFGMMGAPDVLQLNSNLIKLIRGKKILDVGVYTGVSSLAFALAIPDDGKVIAMDITDEYLVIGRPFWKEAGIEHKIDFRIAPATETLQKLIDEGGENTFDFAFMDADKPNYSNYFELCLKLIRAGGIIAIDNTIWSGNVINPSDQTESTKGIRAINEKLKNDTRINLSMLLIGDGLTLCFKK